MTTSANNTTSTTDLTQTTNNTTGYVDPQAKVESPEDNKPAEPVLDENGYEITPKPTEEPPKEEPPKEDPKVETPATGYGDEPPKEEPPKEDPKVEDENATDEEKLKADINEALGDLPERARDNISKFTLDNKMTKEQVENYVALVKSEDALAVKENASQVAKQRSDWHSELKTDPEFGGENFDKNVDRVEKVLEKFMPNTKKVLTERGTMLPPYIMRDFLTLHKTLNPTTKLVNGEASVVKKEEGNFLETMYT